ncbi:carbohydrate porin [Gilliamella apicola]
MNSRISISLDGKYELANHSYAAFSIQPLVDLSGKVNLDDASFYFG